MVGRAAGGYDALVTRVLVPKRADHMVVDLSVKRCVGRQADRAGHH